MPSAEDFLETLEQPEHPTAGNEDEDPWGFNTPPSAAEHNVAGKKKKAKKKLKKNAPLAVRESPPEPARVDELGGDESPAYPSSIATSPPKEQGVRLHAHTDPPAPALGTSPLAAVEPLVNIEDDDDSPPLLAVEEDIDPVPAARLSPKPAPSLLSPPPPSPRPTLVEPASHSNSPPSLRSANLRDRHSSIGSGHRPPAILRSQPPPRRESFTNPASLPRFVDPPPPHMPQAHFFTLPDFGLNLNRKTESGKPAGSDGYCCSLDSLAESGHDISSKKAKDALLVGSDGGMEVYRLLPNKLEVVGRLEGLRGAVLKAKILPCTERFDPCQHLRPLVAVVIHGPVEDKSALENDSDDEPSPRRFQTTVDIYSLQTQAHIDTLYKSPIVSAEQPAYNQLSSLPGPIGNLHISANGRFVVVASGQSGEVFIYTHIPSTGVERPQFRCIGKLWTSLQRPVTGPPRPPNSSDSTTTSSGEAGEMQHEPLFSLGQRWLAVVPPMMSSHICLAGAPLLSEVNPNPPGLATHVAPPQPPVSCEVAGTDIEGAWVRIGRQAAQGLVKYSQKGIQMGLHGWKELTQPSPPGSTSHARTPSKEELFPPTKGPLEDPNRLAKEPALVSIVDLESLLDWEEFKPKHTPLPMATFALVDGCNFLSLSSTGTRLLTTSRKGEISIVWDLSQVAHGVLKEDPQSNEDEGMKGPCIKQLHRIARSTPSTVLNCAWSRDDDALALLTAHGTVHLHEIPKHPIKKRKRRSVPNTPAPEKADATTSLSMGLSPPSSNQGFLGSIKSSWQNVSTQVNSMRTANPAAALGLPTTFAGFREATAAAGNAGSRAVARGISQGYTAAKGGASDYWHAEDNKIRHKALQDIIGSKSLRWTRRHSQNSLVISCGGSVHVHPIQRVERRKGDDIITGLKSDKYTRKSFTLPTITACFSEAEQQPAQSINRFDSCSRQGPHGFWSLRQSTPPPSSSSRRQSGLPGRQDVTSALTRTKDSDVETNPPYCPFHINQRVDILAFDEHAQNSAYLISEATLAEFQDRGHGLANESAWAFGERLPTCTKVNEQDLHGSFAGDEIDQADEDMFRAVDDDDESNRIAGDEDAQVESRLTIRQSRRRSKEEEIRIHTRRKVAAARAKGQEHDGEFELMDEDMD